MMRAIFQLTKNEAGEITIRFGCIAIVSFVLCCCSTLLPSNWAENAGRALYANEVDDDGDEEETVAPVRRAAKQPANGNPASPGKGAPGQPAAAAAGPTVTVTNIDDKEFKATQLDFQEGKLTVKSDPPQTVPLNELQRATLTHVTKLSVEWVGQEIRDLVGIGAIAEANGIQDVHVRAAGLTAKPLTQVSIIARPQFRVWRQDITNSPCWKISTERIGVASVADFYFEPPTKDLFETELELTLTFDDKTTAKATLKVAGHTSDVASLANEEGGIATTGHRLASLQLEGGDTLKGHLVQGAADHVAVDTAWRAAFEVPLLQVRGILFDGVQPEAKTKYDERLAKPGEDDYVLVLSKDGGLAEINGRLQSVSDSGLKILYEEKERSIKLERVQAVVFGSHPATRNWKGPFQTFHLASGDLLSAEWLTFSEKTFQVKTAWGVDLEIAREAVVEVTGRNTKMVNLSELTPSLVEQVPYFDRIVPWVRDKSWNDKPIRLDDKTYKRGLAVHSRCLLTYDLGGDFATFRAVLGFDEEAGDRGRVVCRVVVDSQERFSKPDFRASEKSIPVEVSVKGAKQLRLEVDFGEDQDVGDRVIWANARLYRE